MRSKILSRRAWLITVFFGTALFVASFFYFIPKSSVKIGPVLPTENVVVPSNQVQIGLSADTGVGLPVRLKIPSINVNAGFEYVGLTPDGAMDVPKGPAEVAWFNLGPRPGEKGSAVVAGHYGWKNNIPAVFDNLHKLSEGDKIYIEDENGATITFVVREIKIYNKDDYAGDVFGSNDGRPHLNLVTCTGFWSKTEKTRSERLVVFTDKE